MTSVAAITPAATSTSAAARLSRRMDAIAASRSAGAVRPCRDPGHEQPRSQRLGQDQHVARPCPALAQQPVRMRRPPPPPARTSAPGRGSCGPRPASRRPRARPRPPRRRSPPSRRPAGPPGTPPPTARTAPARPSRRRPSRHSPPRSPRTSLDRRRAAGRSRRSRSPPGRRTAGRRPRRRAGTRPAISSGGAGVAPRPASTSAEHVGAQLRGAAAALGQVGERDRGRCRTRSWPDDRWRAPPRRRRRRRAAGATIPHTGAVVARWRPRSSKPVRSRMPRPGGFDSHALPPVEPGSRAGPGRSPDCHRAASRSCQMPFTPFELEEWQSRWETTVAYNLADSGVRAVRLGELLAGGGPGAAGPAGGEVEARPDDAELARLLDVDLHYPPVAGTPLLRERIASWMGAGPENVLVTVGASEANAILTSTLVEPGDEVVVMEPGYRQIRGIAQNAGAVVLTFPLDPDRGWRPDLDGARPRGHGSDEAHRGHQPEQPGRDDPHGRRDGRRGRGRPPVGSVAPGRRGVPGHGARWRTSSRRPSGAATSGPSVSAACRRRSGCRASG